MASESYPHDEASSSRQSTPRSRRLDQLSDLCRPLIGAICRGFSDGTKVVGLERHGKSSWADTFKVDTIQPHGGRKSYFCKVMSGHGSKASASGEWHSATILSRAAPGHIPRPHHWGQYLQEDVLYSFYLQDYMDIRAGWPPDPAELVGVMRRMHGTTSHNGKFGYFRPTAIGRLERTAKWEFSWAAAFTHQLEDVLGHDRDGRPELHAACGELIRAVVPRLLGVLQSGGRRIVPALIHGDLRERNVGVDGATGRAVIFDPGCLFAHNEMEFGAWRCRWATHFKDGPYLSLYQKHVKISEPVEEWDDRNRLYSIHAYLAASAGRRGSSARLLAYNEMLFLCEKYGAALGEYDPDLVEKLIEVDSAVDV